MHTRLAATALVLLAAAGGAWAVVALTGGPGSGQGSGDGGSRSATAGHQRPAAAPTGARTATTTGRVPAPTTTTLPPTTTTTLPPTTTTVDPGTLPQTGQFPTASSPQFQSEMAALWQGVVTGSPGQAMPAFFPESAYAQLKAIGDPGADWQDRLVAEYDADIAAAHALLGSDPSAATFVGVNVPSQYGHWVTAGVCTNSIGYFEVPNARVVYQEDGRQQSFGIASMISWRGEWYVVHLGAVLRSTPGGQVDEPSTGPGTSAPSSTC